MRKILWVTNVLLPEASLLLDKKPTPFGGWLHHTSKMISKEKNIKLYIASPWKSKNIKFLEADNITYILFPVIKKYTSKLDENISSFVESISPDLIHIFGTEMPHSYAFKKVSIERKIKYAVNLQGIVTLISEQYLSNLPIREILKPNFFSLLTRRSLIKTQKMYAYRGKYEREIICSADFVLGRTTWDKAFFNQIDSIGKYIKWNETLRECFYKSQWKYKSENKYNIFVSQGNYSIKGVHQLIKALNIIITKYPLLNVRIAGKNIMKNSILGLNFDTQYSRYIKSLIKKYNLENNIHYIGLKNEREIVNEYLNSGLVVLPSIIENSPNSLGETMVLGVPIIAAYVGGIPDFINHSVNGFLYNTNEHNTLAYYIDKILNMTENELIEMSDNSMKSSRKIHDITTNSETIIKFYNSFDKVV